MLINHTRGKADLSILLLLKNYEIVVIERSYQSLHSQKMQKARIMEMVRQFVKRYNIFMNLVMFNISISF